MKSNKRFVGLVGIVLSMAVGMAGPAQGAAMGQGSVWTDTDGYPINGLEITWRDEFAL